MKAGFYIYCLLLLLGGLIVLWASHSLIIILGASAGILMYTACCRQRTFLPELVRAVTIVIFVIQAATTLGANLEVIMLVILHIPIYGAATQCVWEMLNPPELRDKRSPEIRVSVFSAGFAACVAIGFMLLLGTQLNLGLAHRQTSAGLFLLLGMVAWERCRISRLKPGASTDTLSLVQSLSRLAIFSILGALFMFISVGLLPLLSEGLAKFSPKMKLPGMKLGKMESFQPKARDGKDAQKQTEPDGPGDEKSRLPGLEAATAGEAPLPGKGRFKPADVPRLAIQFRDPQDGERLVKQDLMYVRTISMTSFHQNVWKPSQLEGWWLFDKDDGVTDGRVQVSKNATDGVQHTLYILDADGTHIPHLAGAQIFGVSKLYSLPDEWFKIEPYGPVKIEAISQPLLYQLQDTASLRAGETVGTQYLEQVDGDMRAQLMGLAQQIFGVKKLPADNIKALADWFYKNLQYSATIENPSNLPPLQNFLFGEKKGFCEHYATAACMLLRMAGLPTRMTFGYHGGIFNPNDQTYVFGKADSHAWTEIYFKDVGWVICDLTPPQPRPVTPEETLAASKGLATNLGSFDGVDAIVERAAEATKKLAVPDISLLERAQKFAISNGQDIGILAAGAALVLLAGNFWKNRKNRKETEEEKAARVAAEFLKQPRYFEEFTKMCQEFGHVYTPDLTLREFEHRLKSVKFYHGEFGEMTTYHYATRYENAANNSAQEAYWIDFIKNFARDQRKLAKDALKA